MIARRLAETPCNMTIYKANYRPPLIPTPG